MTGIKLTIVTYGNTSLAWSQQGSIQARYHLKKGVTMDMRYTYTQRDSYQQSGMTLQAQWLF